MDHQVDELPEVTIYDVARVAGVSASTVSRTFSRPGRVSHRTAERVRAVAEELGYRTEVLVQRSRETRLQTIGLAASDITNPFFSPIIRGAERTARAKGYTLLLTDTQESEIIEQETMNRLLPVVDGIVIASSRTSDVALRSVAKHVPVVVLNRHVPGLPCVITDNTRGMTAAVEHLAGLGHRSVGYVAGPEASWADGVRWRAFHSVATGLGLQVSRVGPVAPTVSGGFGAAGEVAQRGVTGVVAYNDLIAIGIIRGLASPEISVPQDISIVGTDDIFAAALVTPGLTTIAAPTQALGEVGVATVIAISRGATPATGRPQVLPVTLVVRGSTAPPRSSS